MIDIGIQRRFHAGDREFMLDVSLQTSGRRIALYGPSGAGKTLTVHTIAGLIAPDSGRIVVDGVTMFDSAQRICLAPQQRKLGYLQQHYGLFPHLTVKQNIGFGLQRGWWNRREPVLTEAARYWVDAFHLEALLGLYPAQLSGGQKQRVALARALAVQPRLLLLDEPLAALDASLKQSMRQELAALQARVRIPSILITHDPQDAMALADEVYRIHEGRIVERCRPQELSPMCPA